MPPVGVGLPPYFAPTVPLNVTSGGAKWNYAGCFAEIANGRLLPNSLIDAAGGSGSMTPQRCIAACQAGSYAFCGLEVRAECDGAELTNGSTDKSAGLATRSMRRRSRTRSAACPARATNSRSAATAVV